MPNNNTNKKTTPGIYLEKKPVVPTRDLLGFLMSKIPPAKGYAESDHNLLVYKDENGQERVIRGGPVYDQNIRNIITKGASRIETQVDVPRGQSLDKYEKGTEPHTRLAKKLNIPAGQEAAVWKKFKGTATQINDLGINYKNPAYQRNIQNSNSVVNTILQQNGFGSKSDIPDFARKSTPGHDTDLLKNPQLIKRVNLDDPEAPNLQDEKEQKASLEHLQRQDKARELFENYRKNSNPYQDILLKKDEDITQDEINQANKHSAFESKDNVFRKKLDTKISSWYSTIYGDEPVKQDATGRQIESQPRIKIPSEPRKLSTPEGDDVDEGFKKLASQVAEREDGVSRLQRGINELGFQPELKEDGILGGKTAEGIKSTMVSHGWNALQKKLKSQIIK